MVLTKLIQDTQATKDQLGPSDTQNLVFLKFDESITILPSFYQINKTNIGHAFTVGHPVNGIIGTALGIDGEQITIGTGGLGETVIGRIFNDNNIFCDLLRDTTHIDVANSTATVNTTDFKLGF